MVAFPADVETLADYVSLIQLRSAYSHAVDGHRWTEWSELFTEDAVCDFGFRTLDGRAAIEQYGRETLAERFAHSVHTAHMPVIDFDGDETSGSWYSHVAYVLPDGTSGRLYGRYADSYRRVSNEWKFSRIDYVLQRDTGTLLDD